MGTTSVGIRSDNEILSGVTQRSCKCKETNDHPASTARTFVCKIDWVGMSIQGVCKLAAATLVIRMQQRIRTHWAEYSDGQVLDFLATDLVSGRDTDMTPAQAMKVFKSEIATAESYDEVEKLVADYGFDDDDVEFFWNKRARELGVDPVTGEALDDEPETADQVA